MRAGQGTKTAAPNINDIEEEFEKALSAGKDVLFTCLSSGISSTINNAFVCKEEMQEKYPDAEICVFDSICASGGHGLLIYHAIENKKKGNVRQREHAGTRRAEASYRAQIHGG